VDELLGPVGLRYRHSADVDGALRLTLLGEVDLAMAEELAAHLRDLKRSASRVRVDLSQLRFIDLCGLDVILDAMTEARRTGWQLEVDPEVSPSVLRLIQYVGAARTLWPERHRGGGAHTQRCDRSEPRAFRLAASSWRSAP
jgi:anti-anti-sigma factor